jgi:hypothetical protein
MDRSAPLITQPVLVNNNNNNNNNNNSSSSSTGRNGWMGGG